MAVDIKQYLPSGSPRGKQWISQSINQSVYQTWISRVKKVAHTRLPSVGFRSWSRYLAVSLQVTWVIKPAQKGPGSNHSRDLSVNSPRQTVHTHRASVHHAAKLLAALLRVAGVAAGLAESNGSLRSSLWFTEIGNRVWATFLFRAYV